jgi:hypothetical protein
MSARYSLVVSPARPRDLPECSRPCRAPALTAESLLAPLLPLSGRFITQRDVDSPAIGVHCRSGACVSELCWPLCVLPPSLCAYVRCTATHGNALRLCILMAAVVNQPVRSRCPSGFACAPWVASLSLWFRLRSVGCLSQRDCALFSCSDRRSRLFLADPRCGYSEVKASSIFFGLLMLSFLWLALRLCSMPHSDSCSEFLSFGRVRTGPLSAIPGWKPARCDGCMCVLGRSNDLNCCGVFLFANASSFAVTADRL